MTNYFVSTTGSDAQVGNFDKPFRTVAAAMLKANPGDYVYIRGGIYFERVTITKNGSSISPIRIEAYQGESVIFDGRSIDSPNYVRPLLDSAEYQASLQMQGEARKTETLADDIVDDAIFTISSNYIRLTGIEIAYSNGRGIYVEGPANDCRITGCNIHHTAKELVYSIDSTVKLIDCTLWEGVTLNTTPSGKDGYGVDNGLYGVHYVCTDISTHYGTVQGCAIFDIHGGAIFFDGIPEPTIVGNQIGNFAAPAIALVNGSVAHINRNSIFYTDEYPVDKRSKAWVLAEELLNDSQQPLDYIYFEFNVVVHCRWGIFHAGGVEQLITSREADGSSYISQYLTGRSSWSNIYINNNTFVEQVEGNRLARSAQLGVKEDRDDQPCYMSNNIFYEDRGRILVWEEADLETYVFKNNLFSKRPEQYETLTALVGNEGAIIGNPELVNPTAPITDPLLFDVRNYALKTSSVAVGQGTAEYLGSFVDYEGNPVSDPPDLGAIAVSVDDNTVEVDFTISPASGDAPLAVQFTSIINSSAPIAKILWTLGDGTSSTEEHVTHVYQDEGGYDVRLSVTDVNGVTKTVEKLRSVYVTLKQAMGESEAVPSDPETTTVVSPVRPIFFDIVGIASLELTDYSLIELTKPHDLGVVPEMMIFVAHGSPGYYGGAEVSWGVWGRNNLGPAAGCTTIYLKEVLPTETAGAIWSNLTAQYVYQPIGGVSAGHGEVYNEATVEVLSVTKDDFTIRWKGGGIADSVTVYLIGGDQVIGAITCDVMRAGQDYVLDSLGEGTAAMVFGLGSPYGINTRSRGASISAGFIDRIGNQCYVGFGWQDNNPYPDLIAQSGFQVPPVPPAADNRRLIGLTNYSEDPAGVFLNIRGEWQGDSLALKWVTNSHLWDIPFVALVFSTPGRRASLLELKNLPNFGDSPVSFDAGFDIGSAIVLSSTADDIGVAVPGGDRGAGLAFLLAVPPEVSGHGFDSYTSSTNPDQIALNWTSNTGVRQLDSEPSMFTASYGLALSGQDIVVSYLSGAEMDSPRRLYALAFEQAINTNPVVKFKVTTTSGIAGITPFYFHDYTYMNGITDPVFAWDFGDSTFSSEQHPKKLYADPGVYTATLTVSSASAPSKIDDYSMTITVNDRGLIPSWRMEFRGNNISQNSIVKFINTTVPINGANIINASWELRSHVYDPPIVVARAEGNEFQHYLQDAGLYIIALTITQDDGVVATHGTFFRVAVRNTPFVYFSLIPVANASTVVGGIQGKVPAVLRITNASDLRGEELVEIEIGLLNYNKYVEDPELAEPTVRVYGRELYDILIPESGNYLVYMRVQSTGGESSKYYTGFISIAAPDAIPASGISGTIGRATYNVFAPDGSHYHEIRATSEGDPYEIVATDKRGGSSFRFFGINEALSTIYNAVKDVVAAVRGRILFVGTGSGLAGEDIAVDALSLSPLEGVNANLGTYQSNWDMAYINTLVAGNLVKRGFMTSIDGTVFVGQSHDLVRDIDVGDTSIYIRDGRRITLGDYLLLSRDSIFEVMQVTAWPVEDAHNIEEWAVSVKRGREVSSIVSASKWYIGDVLINLGGGKGGDGAVILDTWIEILNSRSIDSIVRGDDAERAPAIVGNYRFGPELDKFRRFFVLGDLKGIYGFPETAKIPGIALGQDSPMSVYMLFANGEIKIVRGGGQEYVRITDRDGISVIIDDIKSARNGYSLELEDGKGAGVFGAYRVEGESAIITYLEPGNAEPNRVLSLSNGRDVSVQLIDSATEQNGIIIKGLPTSDPGVPGALYISAGTLKISL